MHEVHEARSREPPKTSYSRVPRKMVISFIACPPACGQEARYSFREVRLFVEKYVTKRMLREARVRSIEVAL